MNVSQVLDAAETHLSNGRDAAAQRLFVEALEHSGGAARAAGGLATIALRAGDVDKARELFGRGLAVAPENAELLVGLAAVHLATQRTEEAETCLRRAMRLDPALPAAPANLALIALSRRDLDGARTLAREALVLAPESADAVLCLAGVELVRGDAGAARELYEKAVALVPDRADARIGLATVLQLAGDVAGAVESLERARLLEPDSPAVLVRLAQCRTALGELEVARTLVRQAAAVAPADSEVRNAQGMVLMHSGRYEEALTALRLAAQYNPRSSAPLVNLALLMRRTHQTKAALVAIREAIALDGHVDAGARRIEIDLLFLSGEWREAWRGHDELVALDRASGGVAAVPDGGLTEFGPRLALIVDDLPSALMGLRLLHCLATDERRIRLLCLPAYAGFFRALPGVDSAEAREAIDLSRDIEAGEMPLLLDDLPRLLRGTPACLAPLGLDAGALPPGGACATSDSGAWPRIGLWWEDTPGGPDPLVLLNALPGTPALLREPHPDRTVVLPDGRTPTILVGHGVEDLLEMARILLSLDLVVAVDGPVAHLAANLNCRTIVICMFDIPWYWQSCGSDGDRWYPTARAVVPDAAGDWSALTDACDYLLSGTASCTQEDAAFRA